MIAYIVATVGVALLMYFTRGERHRTEGEVEVFKYRALLGWIAALGPVFVGVLVISTFDHPLSFKWVTSLSVTSKAGFLFTGFFWMVGLWAKTFCIKMDQNTLNVSSCFNRRTTYFRDIRKITIKESVRWDVLDVFNSRGKRVLNVTSSIQEFDDLVYLLKERTAQYRAEVKRRDVWGKWSDDR